MLLALSVSSEIKTVGSYAGLAALLGLAILALLYFAQARETRRLSEWIEREEERRASAPAFAPAAIPVARASAPAQGPPPPATAAGTITTAVPGVRRVAVPPAGVVAAAAGAGATAEVALTPEVAAAPMPSETTRIVPIPFAAPATPAAAGLAAPAERVAGEAAPQETVPAGAADVAAPETAVVAGTSAAELTPADEHAHAGDASAAQDQDEDAGPPTGAMEPADLPSAAVPLVAQDAPSAEPRRVKWPPLAVEEDPRGEQAVATGPTEGPPAPAEASPFGPSTPAGARPRFPPPPPSAVAAPVDAEATVRSAGAAAFGAPAAVAAPAPEPTRRREREDPAAQDEGGGHRSIASTLKLLLAAIVIVVALILVAEQVFGGSSRPPTPSSTQTTNSVSNAANAPAPSTVTVGVLNGTHTANLASGAWGVLSKLGFRKGAIADAPAQNHRITFIAFTGANRAAAVEVARDLSIATVHVHSTIDTATLAAATATGHAPPAVVVILGANYPSG